jgi:hypothetical protein
MKLNFTIMLFNTKRTDSLLKLLDDPDPYIYEQIKDELIRFGTGIIPYLENHQLQPQSSSMFNSRVEKLIDELRFASIHSALQEWSASDDKNLLNAFIQLSRLQYPEQDETFLLDEINHIKQKIWLELNPRMTSFEQIKVFNRVFFEIIGFTYSDERYGNPRSVHLHDMIVSKKGTSLGLSILYSSVAQLLQIPVYCVLLPNLTILAYLDNLNLPFRRFIKNKYGILFYFNPANEGSFHDDKAIEYFLQKNETTLDRSYFEPSSNTCIIQSLIDELIENTSNIQKITELRLLKESLNPSSNNIIANI